MNYRGKHVAVLGLGRSGEAAARLLATLGARVTLLDSAGGAEKLAPKIQSLSELGIEVITGVAAEQASMGYDLAVLSPGIDPKVVLARNFLQQSLPVISEIELAYQYCACPVIGITGTNGKTTTTELVAAMLAGAGVRTVAAGNIGKPFSEAVREGTENLDVVTLELSSFQLERIQTFRPAVSAWLNFAPDHLDRYASTDEYRTAKLRIFENQTPDDCAVVNFRDKLPPLAARQITFSAYCSGGDLDLRGAVIHYRGEPLLDQARTGLRGRHNAENLMAAIGIGLARGLDATQMSAGLMAYRPAPHRCEIVRELGGVEYVNDSKATNLDSLEKALLSVGEHRRIVLIAGGKDKGFEFDSLAPVVGGNVRKVVLIGEMAERIAKSWSKAAPCELAATLPEAVQLAWTHARSGETVLFSPGTSSFDMFRDYADRGGQFRALVEALPAAGS